MLWALSFLGLFLLLISGDFLVKGAIQLSNRLGVSALLVSLTVVAFGTSAPEVAFGNDFFRILMDFWLIFGGFGTDFWRLFALPSKIAIL